MAFLFRKEPWYERYAGTLVSLAVVVLLFGVVWWINTVKSNREIYWKHGKTGRCYQSIYSGSSYGGYNYVEIPCEDLEGRPDIELEIRYK